jgi:glycine cleavage system regulatory protein
MSEISALEGRITAALDRIRRGVEAQGGPDTELAAALAQERAAKDELAAQLQAQDGQGAKVASLTAALEAQQLQMQKLDAELQRLRASNAQMREMNTQLREAVTTGLAPELLDQAVAAELAALQAQRSADAAELEAVLAALKPAIEEGSHAAS